MTTQQGAPCTRHVAATAHPVTRVSQNYARPIHGALYRTSLKEMDTLPTALFDAFVQLHAQMTDNYSLCEDECTKYGSFWRPVEDTPGLSTGWTPPDAAGK